MLGRPVRSTSRCSRVLSDHEIMGCASRRPFRRSRGRRWLRSDCWIVEKHQAGPARRIAGMASRSGESRDRAPRHGIDVGAHETCCSSDRRGNRVGNQADLAGIEHGQRQVRDPLLRADQDQDLGLGVESRPYASLQNAAIDRLSSGIPGRGRTDGTPGPRRGAGGS